MNEPRVFITDGFWRKTLAAVRSLGSRGIRVTCGECTRMGTALWSKYCHASFVYPSPHLEPERFLSALELELSSKLYQVLIPMEEYTLLLILEQRERFERLARVPFPAIEQIRLARDKAAMYRYASGLGIPIPKTWYPKSLEEAQKLARLLPYPVVLKPRTGSGSEGVSYLWNPAQLIRAYGNLHQTHPMPLIQERIPSQGVAYGYNALISDAGELLGEFVYKRLREYPVSGGPSTLRESCLQEEVREQGRKLLTALSWRGVAMVEFKHNPATNQMMFLELNPRFWGSLALAVAAGVDFPYLLYRMAVGDPLPPVTSYKLGVRCRFLLPGDILHLLTHPSPLSILPEFLRFWQPDLHYDIVSRSDPLPTVGRILSLGSLYFNPEFSGVRARHEKR